MTMVHTPQTWPTRCEVRPGVWACFYCAVEHWHGCAHETVDHVWPRRLGGLRIDGNTVTACRSCNSSKGPRVFPDDWVPAIDENTLVLPGLWTWPRVPRTAGLVAIGLRDLLEGATAPYSVVDIAATTCDDPRRVQEALRRLRDTGCMTFRATQALPWQRYFSPA